MSRKAQIKIIDIKIDRPRRIALISVEVKVGKEKWNKPYRLKVTDKITLEDFKAKVYEDVVTDLEVDNNLEEILNPDNSEFSLDLTKKLDILDELNGKRRKNTKTVSASK